MTVEELIAEINARGLVMNLFQIELDKWQVNIHKPHVNSYQIAITQDLKSGLQQIYDNLVWREAGCPKNDLIEDLL